MNIENKSWVLFLHDGHNFGTVEMSIRILLRLDDACPTMAPEPWGRFEVAFDATGISPIVGVIPDCRDSSLSRHMPDPHFWDHVRRWDSKGWTIAMHGLHHVYHPDPIGSRSLLPFHRHGEFVGYSLAEQREILAKARAHFDREGVTPRLFMAPSHSFDRTTLDALRLETDIHWVTDGLSFRPFARYGVNWLPQQAARFAFWMQSGTWTICLHPNVMSTDDVIDTLSQIARFRDRIVSFAGVPDASSYGLPDRVFAFVYWSARRLRTILCRKN